MEMSFNPPSYEATMSATMTVNPSFDDTSVVVDGSPPYDDSDLPPAYDSIYNQNTAENTGEDNTEAPSFSATNIDSQLIENDTRGIAQPAQNESGMQNSIHEREPSTSQDVQSDNDTSNDQAVSTV